MLGALALGLYVSGYAGDALVRKLGLLTSLAEALADSPQRGESA
jgi:hypothetical protein